MPCRRGPGGSLTMKRIAASLLAVGLLAAPVRAPPPALVVAPLLASPGRALACRDFAQAPGSRWRLEARQRVAWLVTPCGDPFFSIGINALNGGGPAREAAGRIAYHWRSFYPRFDAWLATTRARTATWGFNTARASSPPPGVPALPPSPPLALGRTARLPWRRP